ncbi:EpsG family protein [Selenomonas bovis]|uniref:EpsG family protein n=1 Tax=Selenomonas bovis TaxID=416586 RepID=UPI003D08F809
MSYQEILYFVYFLVLFLAINERFINSDSRDICLYILSCLLILTAAFRPIGDTLDTPMYVSVFEDIPDAFDWINFGFSHLEEYHLEYGYLIANSFVKFIINEYRIFLLIISTVTISIYAIIFKKNSPYPLLALFCYVSILYVFREIVQIRNGMACALVLYSFQYIWQKNCKKFYFYNFLAGCFHITAFAALPLYVLSKINWDKKKLIILFSISMLLFQLEWIDNLMSLLLGNTSVFYRVTKYYGDVNAFREVNDIKVLVYGILGVGLLFFGNIKDYKYRTLIFIFFAGIFFQSSFHEFREVADRGSAVLYTSLFLLIPMCIKYSKYRNYLLFVLYVTLPLYFYRTVNWLTNPLQ